MCITSARRLGTAHNVRFSLVTCTALAVAATKIFGSPNAAVLICGETIGRYYSIISYCTELLAQEAKI